MRLLRSLSTATALMVAVALPLRAQSGTTSSGRVINESGVPLPSETVTSPSLCVGANTNADGSYTIVVPASRANGQSATILARVIGYSASSTPVILTAGSNLTQNFAAALAPHGVRAPRYEMASAH